MFHNLKSLYDLNIVLNEIHSPRISETRVSCVPLLGKALRKFFKSFYELLSFLVKYLFKNTGMFRKEYFTKSSTVLLVYKLRRI